MEATRRFDIGDYIEVRHKYPHEHPADTMGFILSYKVSEPHHAKVYVVKGPEKKVGTIVTIDTGHEYVYPVEEGLTRRQLEEFIDLAIILKDKPMFMYATEKLNNYQVKNAVI